MKGSFAFQILLVRVSVFLCEKELNAIEGRSIHTLELEVKQSSAFIIDAVYIHTWNVHDELEAPGVVFKHGDVQRSNFPCVFSINIGTDFCEQLNTLDPSVGRGIVEWGVTRGIWHLIGCSVVHKKSGNADITISHSVSQGSSTELILGIKSCTVV